MAAGSGAGAEITALGESLQAYACATRQHLKKDLTSVSEITSDTVRGYAFCDRTLNDCLKKLDAKWFNSVVVTANKIFSELPKGTGRYRFYRGEDIVKSIESEFESLKKGSGIANINKWNPADIWMAKEDFKLKTGHPTLCDFNKYLYDQYKEGNLYGISLKQIPKGDAHSKVYNGDKPITAEYSGIKLGANMYDSKDIYLQYTSEGKNGEIQLRDFSGKGETGSWQGEIKGKTAAGGKIGGGKLIEAAVESGVPSSMVPKPSSFNIQKTNPSSTTIKNFAKMFKELSGSRESQSKLELDASVYAKEDVAWWVSKYLGVSYVYALKKQNKLNEATKWMFEYGSSTTKNSSIFIKYM